MAHNAFAKIIALEFAFLVSASMHVFIWRTLPSTIKKPLPTDNPIAGLLLSQFLILGMFQEILRVLLLTEVSSDLHPVITELS